MYDDLAVNVIRLIIPTIYYSCDSIDKRFNDICSIDKHIKNVVYIDT